MIEAVVRKNNIQIAKIFFFINNEFKWLIINVAVNIYIYIYSFPNKSININENYIKLTTCSLTKLYGVVGARFDIYRCFTVD